MKLTFITGKGGVGKSAVTAGLATALASLNYKVGIVELGETRMADFFGSTLDSHVTLFNLTAKSCFEEYAGLHLPRQALLLIKNRWVEHFIDATPGLNEILLLGKITSLLEEERWDFLLVDSPATGHTLSLCDAPRIAMQALNHGPLKSTIQKIWGVLHNPDQTHFLLVTLLESFVVQETIELYQHVRDTLQLASKGILLNGLMEEGAPEDNTIPKKFPPEASPLAAILSAAEIRKNRERELLKKLKREMPVNFGGIPWENLVTKETDLRKKIAEKIKPWALQNYSKKNG